MENSGATLISCGKRGDGEYEFERPVPRHDRRLAVVTQCRGYQVGAKAAVSPLPQHEQNRRQRKAHNGNAYVRAGEQPHCKGLGMGKAPGKSSTYHTKRDTQQRQPSKTGEVERIRGGNGDLKLLEPQSAGGHACGERGCKRGKQRAVFHASCDQYFDRKDRGGEGRSEESGKAGGHADKQKRVAGVSER